MNHKIYKFSTLFTLFLTISIISSTVNAVSKSKGELSENSKNPFVISSSSTNENLYGDFEFTPAKDFYNSIETKVSYNKESITFDLEKAGFVNIKIYDETGRVIDELARSSFSAGSHRIIWNSSEFPKGNYYCSVITEEYSQTKKLK